MKKKNNFIVINSSFQFHQAIQPIDKKSMEAKEKIFKENLEKRVLENLKRLNSRPE